jgi:hypothetical protein
MYIYKLWWKKHDITYNDMYIYIHHFITKIKWYVKLRDVMTFPGDLSWVSRQVAETPKVIHAPHSKVWDPRVRRIDLVMHWCNISWYSISIDSWYMLIYIVYSIYICIYNIFYIYSISIMIYHDISSMLRFDISGIRSTESCCLGTFAVAGLNQDRRGSSGDSGLKHGLKHCK